MAEKKTIELEVQSNVGSLRSQLRQAQQEVAAMAEKFGETSKEAAAAAKKAAELKDKIQDAKQLTDAFHPEAKFNAFAGALGGVAGGFEAAQGAMAMFGAESKDVQKALLAVQSAMALSQGINTVLESKDAFKALYTQIMATAVGQRVLTVATSVATVAMEIFNLVMEANPVGMLIAGITALIGLFMFFTRETGHAKEAAQDYTRALEDQRRAIDQNFESLQKRQKERTDLMKIQGASEKELFDQQQKNTKELAKSKAEAHRKEKYSYQNLRLLYKQLMDQGEEEEAANIREQLKSSRERYNELKRQSKDYYHQIYMDNKIFVAQNKKKVEENAEKVKQNAIDVKNHEIEKAQERAEKNREIRQNELAQIDQFNKDARDLFLTDYVKQRRDLIAKYDAQIALAKKYKLDITDIEKAKNEEVQKLDDSQVDLTRLGMEKVATLQIKKLEHTKELQEQEKQGLVGVLEVKERIAKREDELAEKDKERNRMRVQAVQDSLSMISDITTLFAGKSKKEQEKAFKIQKAVNIANAVIDTYKAADTALASAPPPFNFIAMGAVITAGLVNVKKIADSKFEGGQVPSDTGGNNPSTGSSVMSPSFNVVGNSGFNQLAQLQQQPMKAYVVSGDVTTAQALDRNRIENATLVQ